MYYICRKIIGELRWVMKMKDCEIWRIVCGLGVPHGIEVHNYVNYIWMMSIYDSYIIHYSVSMTYNDLTMIIYDRNDGKLRTKISVNGVDFTVSYITTEFITLPNPLPIRICRHDVSGLTCLCYVQRLLGFCLRYKRFTI